MVGPEQVSPEVRDAMLRRAIVMIACADRGFFVDPAAPGSFWEGSLSEMKACGVEIDVPTSQ
jgi:hypothetical protein